MKSLLMIIALVPAPAFAAFTVIDTFDALDDGALGGQNAWTAGSQWAVGAAPAGGSGKAAIGTLATTSSAAYRALTSSIANTSTAATLFYRIYRSGAVNISAGLSDDAAPALFGGYEAQVNNQGGDNFLVRDAGAFDNLGAGTFQNLTWYNIWTVVDNATDTYQVYIEPGNFGAPVTATTPVPDPNGAPGDSTFGFRNGTSANALTTALLALGGTNPALTGTFYVDDIFIDTAGQNLSNPTFVPEPNVTVLALGALLLATLRRRRH